MARLTKTRLREVFVQFAPLPCARRHVFLGVDTSSLFRPEAVTSADRTRLSLPNVPEASHAVSPGWVISSVVLRPVEAGQGTFVLDSRRVQSSALATEVAASQVLAVVDLLVARGLRKVDHWRSLVCLCSVSGAHDERASQLPVAGQSQSGLLSPRPRSPAWSAWGQPQGWSAVEVAATRAHTANQMPVGRARMLTASGLRFIAGTSCICGQRGGSRSA